MTMNASLVSDECKCDQKEYNDEHDALFVFRELESPEEPLHLYLILSC